MSEPKCEKCDKTFNSAEALQMHGEAKHPAEVKRPLLSKKQKNRIRNYGIALIFLLAITGFFYWKSLPVKNAPIISVSSSVYNFGTVSQSEGIAEGSVEITNTGASDLILKDMETSCMCTSVTIVDDEGKEGPPFGMRSHGTNPTNWQETISPGESRTLKIYYDPNVHKDLTGSVSRSITIFSNDPKQKRTNVRAEIFQTV